MSESTTVTQVGSSSTALLEAPAPLAKLLVGTSGAVCEGSTGSRLKACTAQTRVTRQPGSGLHGSPADRQQRPVNGLARTELAKGVCSLPNAQTG